MRCYRRGRVALTLLFLLLAPAAGAWNDAGHLAIALAAYDGVAGPTRARLDEIVRAFPRFGADFEALRPRSLEHSGVAERARWYFAFASTWPDRARRFGHVADRNEREALVRLYHRGSWHYVNIPTYLEPRDEASLKIVAPSLATPRGVADSDLNVVEALDRLLTLWRSPGASAADRALALAWILHLVADLHQPLHATSLYAQTLFPSGDRGGNELTVQPGGNLHALWDGALGSSRRNRDLEGLVVALSSQIGALRGPLGSLDFAAWARESQMIAADRAYTSSIRALVTANRSASGPLSIALGIDYREAMKRAARSRASLATARLVLVLEALAGASA